MLEIQQQSVPERRVVEGRHVPDPVNGQPDRQRDERMNERSYGAVTGEGSRQGGGDPDHGERGRPLRERDVLEEVRPEEVVQRQRRERADDGGQGDEESRVEGAPPHRRDLVLTDNRPVGDRYERKGGDLFPCRVPTPGRRRGGDEH